VATLMQIPAPNYLHLSTVHLVNRTTWYTGS